MEIEFVRQLQARLQADPRVLVGIGDDAAVLRLTQDRRCVVTVDLLTEGVDFLLDQVAPERIGRKALAVNLSDLAAMGARPLAAVVALALPRAGALELAERLYTGILPLAQQHRLAIAGGDTNTWDGPLVLSITALGEVTERGSLLRSGAKPDDVILVTGQFGGSILGHQFDFEPRVNEALLLAQRYTIHAAIDVSDGLSLDLARLAAASGCGAELDLSQIPIAPAARELTAQQKDGSTALDHALSDGEDFELVLAVPQETTERMLAEQPLACGLTAIGRFVAEPGLWQVEAGGVRRPLEPRGYLHGSDRSD